MNLPNRSEVEEKLWRYTFRVPPKACGFEIFRIILRIKYKNKPKKLLYTISEKYMYIYKTRYINHNLARKDPSAPERVRPDISSGESFKSRKTSSLCCPGFKKTAVKSGIDADTGTGGVRAGVSVKLGAGPGIIDPEPESLAASAGKRTGTQHASVPATTNQHT